MLKDRRTVFVALDVHKSSIRMAALKDGELLNERTLPYDAEPLIERLTTWLAGGQGLPGSGSDRLRPAPVTPESRH